MEKIETKVVKPEMSFFENDVNNIIMNPQEEFNLDSKVKSIEDYMRSTSGKGKTEQEKDELYQTAQKMWHDFVESIKGAKFNFHLNRPQHKFLTDLILTKMEYDVNTVFFAIELTNMMSGLKEAKYTNDKDLLSFEVNSTEITYIYHLISKHKVKGLSKDAYTFANVLYRIGNISKIFNYYETSSKNLSTDVQNWVMTFEEGIEYEKFKNQESIEVESTTEVAG
jgi:uncharacterized protein YjaG (DUF416 family)